MRKPAYIVKIQQGHMSETAYRSISQLILRDAWYDGIHFAKIINNVLHIRGYAIFFLRKILTARYMIDEPFTLERVSSDMLNLTFVQIVASERAPPPSSKPTSAPTRRRPQPPRAHAAPQASASTSTRARAVLTPPASSSTGARSAPLASASTSTGARCPTAPSGSAAAPPPAAPWRWGPGPSQNRRDDDAVQRAPASTPPPWKVLRPASPTPTSADPPLAGSSGRTSHPRPWVRTASVAPTPSVRLAPDGPAPTRDAPGLRRSRSPRQALPQQLRLAEMIRASGPVSGSLIPCSGEAGKVVFHFHL